MQEFWKFHKLKQIKKGPWPFFYLFQFMEFPKFLHHPINLQYEKKLFLAPRYATSNGSMLK